MTTSEPTITPIENGPYRLEGVGKITRWSDGQALPIDGRAMLCRCGGSANKPFCDGTHSRNGFSGAKDPERVQDQIDSYTSSDGRLKMCRCGESTNKPFCSGAHWYANFDEDIEQEHTE